MLALLGSAASPVTRPLAGAFPGVTTPFTGAGPIKLQAALVSGMADVTVFLLDEVEEPDPEPPLP
jgi:hypothetical protein